MKKKIIILLVALMLCFAVCGCDTDNMTKVDADAKPISYGTYEWVSPDGVHYWVYRDTYHYGIAPRYDSNGDLVIDAQGD